MCAGTCTYAYNSVRVSDMIRGAINKGTGADASPEYRVSELSSESADSTGAGSRARRCGARGPTPFVPAAVSAAVDTCTRVVCRCGVPCFCLQRYSFAILLTAVRVLSCQYLYCTNGDS